MDKSLALLLNLTEACISLVDAHRPRQAAISLVRERYGQLRDEVNALTRMNWSSAEALLLSKCKSELKARRTDGIDRIRSSLMGLRLLLSHHLAE